MSDTKRILPWENWDKLDTECICKQAITIVATYYAEQRLSGKWAAVVSVRGLDMDIKGRFDTLDAAMDACEADYLARCTEFLKLAGPGECVVKVEDVADAATFMLATKKGAGIIRDGVLVTPDYIRERLTAAIDAANKE